MRGNVFTCLRRHRAQPARAAAALSGDDGIRGAHPILWLLLKLLCIIDATITRSEERRVGKECRSRLSLDDKKKTTKRSSHHLTTITVFICSSKHKMER